MWLIVFALNSDLKKITKYIAHSLKITFTNRTVTLPKLSQPSNGIKIVINNGANCSVYCFNSIVYLVTFTLLIHALIVRVLINTNNSFNIVLPFNTVNLTHTNHIQQNKNYEYLS